MQILTLEEFLKLPPGPGIVFSKYKLGIFVDICIKYQNQGTDGFVYSPIQEIDNEGGIDYFKQVNKAMNGISVPMDLDATRRDNVRDKDQLFAVWEKEDVVNLTSLLTSLISAYPTKIKEKTMIIGIDFDGTLVDHEVIDQQVIQLGKPVPGALEAVKSFQDLGAKLVLWTMRSEHMNGRDHLSIAVDYMVQNGITLYGINTNPTQGQWTKSPKLYANLVIDDTGFGCPLIHPEGFVNPCVDWSIVRPQVEEMLKRHRAFLPWRTFNA